MPRFTRYNLLHVGSQHADTQLQVCACEKVVGVTIVAVAIVAIGIVDAMLIVVVTVAVVVLTVVAIVVMVPPYSPSPSPSSSFSAYVGHHWHRRSRFISSSLPPWSSSSSAVVHAVIAIVTISIAIWFLLKSPFVGPRITRLPRLTRLGRGSPGDRLDRL